MLQRRGLLLGLLATPAIIRTPGLLMSIAPFRVSASDVQWTNIQSLDYGWARSLGAELTLPNGQVLRHAVGWAREIESQNTDAVMRPIAEKQILEALNRLARAA